jgi:hypothetical protein
MGYGIACTNSAGTFTVDHSCFSTAALGTGTISDGGGNLLSKTAANQFVAAGTNFRLKQGADCINAGATDSTRVPAAVDIIGTSRPQSTSWDIGAYEFLGVPVMRDIVVGIVTGATRFRDVLAPAEWRANIAVTVDTAFPIEWGTGAAFQRDISVPVEWVRTILRDSAAPAEFGYGLAQIASAPIGITATGIASALVSTEWQAMTRRDVLAPVEWRSNFQRDTFVPADFGLSVLLDNPAGMTWGGTLVRSDAAPIEFGGGMQIGGVAFPMEFMGSRQRDSAAPVEWIVLGMFASTSTFPVEWGGGVLLSGLVPIEPQGLLRIDAGTPIEWGSGRQRDASMPMAMLSAIFTDAPVAIANSALTRADSPAPVEPLSSLVLSATFPVDALRGAVRDDPSAMAFGGGVMTSQPIPAEVGSGTAMTYTVPVEWGASLFVATVANVTWFGGFLLDAGVPLEFGHLTQTTTTDATIALEFGSVVGRSDAAFLEFGRGQRSIGSVLEPDEWEREHDPPGLPEEPH